MVEIGDKINHYIEATGTKKTGTVVWIHPEKRFYVVEFEFRNGKFTEAFPMIAPKRLASTVKDFNTKYARFN